VASASTAAEEETMTRSQWTAAAVFGASILLIGAAWRFYAEGFTRDVAVMALMAVLFLAAHIGRSRSDSPQP
jgi:hypothetical protein